MSHTLLGGTPALSFCTEPEHCDVVGLIDRSPIGRPLLLLLLLLLLLEC
jgi:hypothetical protein